MKARDSDISQFILNKRKQLLKMVTAKTRGVFSSGDLLSIGLDNFSIESFIWNDFKWIDKVCI